MTRSDTVQPGSTAPDATEAVDPRRCAKPEAAAAAAPPEAPPAATTPDLVTCPGRPEPHERGYLCVDPAPAATTSPEAPRDRSCAHPGCLTPPTGEVTTFYCAAHHPYRLPARFGSAPCLSEREQEIDRLRAALALSEERREAAERERDGLGERLVTAGFDLADARSKQAAAEERAERAERELAALKGANHG